MNQILSLKLTDEPSAEATKKSEPDKQQKHLKHIKKLASRALLEYNAKTVAVSRDSQQGASVMFDGEYYFDVNRICRYTTDPGQIYDDSVCVQAGLTKP